MVYFLDTMPTIGNQSKIPSYLHMMQHVYRSKLYEARLILEADHFVPCVTTIWFCFSYKTDVQTA